MGEWDIGKGEAGGRSCFDESFHLKGSSALSWEQFSEEVMLLCCA